MQMFKKGRFDFWKYGQGIQGEIRIIIDKSIKFLKKQIVFLERI